MRLSFVLSSNNATINLNNYTHYKRIKVTKFRMIPDTVTANAICFQIMGIDSNFIVSSTVCNSYFFMIPFLNNLNVLSYSNDLRDTWDYVSDTEKVINKLDIRITNESGQLLTINNSNIIIELLIE